MAIWNERIHERRIENGITLAQVAEKLGVTEATAQRYERGNIKNIPYEHMCVYGEILHCSPAYLMGWEDNEQLKEDSSKIMQYYKLLNDIGKYIATERVKELTEVSRYVKEYKTTESPLKLFTDPVKALNYLEKHNIAAFNGVSKLSNEEIIELANIALNSQNNGGRK